MKYSQFNAIIPFEGKYALYNSFEQKVIFLEEELKELLDAGITGDINELEEIHPTFYDYLLENKFLVSLDTDEVQNVKNVSKRVDENTDNFHLTINPTMNCNFKCWYCYETHIKDSRLEQDVLDSVLLFITKTVEKRELKTFNLSFFGGEPLLYFKKNVIPVIDHIKKVCEREKKEYTVAFTTNGYLINKDFIDYFKTNNIHPHLQITFDGYGEEHDQVRFVTKERGSYKEIVANIKELLLSDNFSITARINYTAKNIQNSHKIINDFKEIPLKIRNEKLVFDFHRVWQDNNADDADTILTETTNKMQEEDFKTSIHYSPNNVLNSCYADKRNSATINYNGDIYKCTARDFLPKNRAGYLDVDGDLIWENDYLEKRMDSKFKNKPCLSCKILPLCNGGCSQHAVEHLEENEEYCIYSSDENQKDKVVYTKINEIINA
jgi:uncharacterized protein